MSDGAGKGDRCRSYGKAYRGGAYWGGGERGGSVVNENKKDQVGGGGGSRSGNHPPPTTSPGDSGESGINKPLKTSGDPTDEILRLGKRHDGKKT